MPRVLNKRTDGEPIGSVYVGRPTRWGNPMHMISEKDRDFVCDYFENFMMDPTHQAIRDACKRELKGKDLVCWCAPLRCHADTLLRIANEDDEG